MRWKRWIGYFEFSNFIFCFNLKNSTPAIFLLIKVKVQIWISVFKNKSSAALLFFSKFVFHYFPKLFIGNCNSAELFQLFWTSQPSQRKIDLFNFLWLARSHYDFPFKDKNLFSLHSSQLQVMLYLSEVNECVRDLIKIKIR